MQNKFETIGAENPIDSLAVIHPEEIYLEQINSLLASISGDARAIVSALKNHKGQHVRAIWKRKLKTLKSAGNLTIEKKTIAYVRAGINFANLATVQTGIANGERGEVQSLPWGEWVESPFIIRHKGNEYLRLYPASFDNLKPRVEYTLNGVPCDAETVKPFCLASEFRDSEEKIECFTIKAESLVAIARSQLSNTSTLTLKHYANIRYS